MIVVAGLSQPGIRQALLLQSSACWWHGVFAFEYYARSLVPLDYQGDIQKWTQREHRLFVWMGTASKFPTAHWPQTPCITLQTFPAAWKTVWRNAQSLAHCQETFLKGRTRATGGANVLHSSVALMADVNRCNSQESSMSLLETRHLPALSLTS